MRIVLAFLLVLLAMPAFAQDGDRGKRVEQARMFIDITTADSVMGPMLDAMWPTIEAQIPGEVSLEVTTRLKATFSSEITAALSDVLDEMAGLYADTFTLPELAAINKFYTSAAGAKLVANQGALMQQMLPTITARLGETMPAAVQRVLEQAEEDGLIEN